MNYFYQLAETTCTINGRTGTPEECEKLVDTFLNVGLFIFIPFLIIGIILFVWWIITLVHVLTHEDVPNRIVWIVLHFVGLQGLVAPIYYFAVQRPYEKSKNNTPSAATENKPKTDEKSV